MENLISLLVAVAVAMGTGIASYRQATKKQSQQGRIYQTDKERLAAENTQLQKRLADVDVILADLRKQVALLSHYQELYTTLKEAHEGLKQDHLELKTKFEARSMEWQAVTGDLVKEQERRTGLEKQNADLFEANKALASQIAAYERVFKLQGQLLEIKAKPTPEPCEDKPSDTAPEGSEIKSEETTAI